MKFRFLFFSLILSLYLSACENPIFRKITGVYEASFETNGGSPVDSFEAVTIKTAPVPTKDGYYFEGWHINSSFADKKVEFPYDLADDTKFYAKWLKPCTVTFETNGGTPISSYVTAIISTSPITTKNGYYFYGWYTNSDFSGDTVFFPYEPFEDTVLYARWLQFFTVTFETNGGDALPSQSMAVISESPVTSKTGYRFNGWYLDSNFVNQISFPYTLSSDVTLYAKWIEIPDPNITETLTYTKSMAGVYYIKWKNSGHCVTSNPYLYKEGEWYGWPNNGSISLSKGTHTFYLGIAPSSGGTRISNILTIVVDDSPYY
ncbi:InlB B-repeat-containing protein [Treponema sp.]|uniref:InlB B-repeat-containing protein n=1 Tax=Treponema sp. TaxID=166 RepID=UPI0025F0CCE5|nr:InlB B-repeat-containing protein [Treponema sp.]MBR4322707.1 InlB B-repeat-containing protein [Treponema sp.]